MIKNNVVFYIFFLMRVYNFFVNLPSILVKQAMIELLENQPLKTVTPDRWKEFSKYAEISQELNLVELHLT